jgi:glutaredoxin
MKIEVHSKTTCPWCHMAKDYLRSHDIPYMEYVHDDDVERQALYDSLGLMGNERTVPQIILVKDDGVSMRVGGYMDLLRNETVRNDMINPRQVQFDMEF